MVLPGSFSFRRLRRVFCFVCTDLPSSDLVITNGHIIDARARRWYSGDLGIRTENRGPSGISPRRPASARSTLKHGRRARVHRSCWGSRRTPSWSIRAAVQDLSGRHDEITGEGGSIAPLNDAIITADKTKYTT